MFLFGSIALRRNHFILTGIGIFIASMVFTLFGLLYAKIIFGDTNNLNVSFISSDNTLLAYIAIAIFHIVNRNSNFKLYYSYFNNNFLNDIAKELYIFLQKNNAKTFLSFDTILNSELTKQKYLFVKDTVQFYTYSKQLEHLFNNKQKYQAGFGDVIYT